MSLSGLTLVEVGGGNHNSERSVVILEILSSCPGTHQWLTEWMNGGVPVICGMKLTEVGAYLYLLPENDDSESLRTSWLANNAEFCANTGVTAQDLGL